MSLWGVVPLVEKESTLLVCSPKMFHHVRQNAPKWASNTQLSKADLLTFVLSPFGPFLVKVPKGDHVLFPGP